MELAILIGTILEEIFLMTGIVSTKVVDDLKKKENKWT